MSVKDFLKKVKGRLFVTYTSLFLVAVLIVILGSPIEHIRWFFSQYRTISAVYGIGIILLTVFYYRELEGNKIKEIEERTFYFLGPFPSLFLDVLTNISFFYVGLLVINHVFTGTFSNGLLSTENVIITIVMGSLVYQCFSHAIKMGRNCFIAS